MADAGRHRHTTSTYGNNAYDLDYFGDVAAVPASAYVPPSDTVPREAPAARPYSPTRVRVRVREQQAVAPAAIIGFAAVAIAVVAVLFAYIQLNQVYAETVELQAELSELESEGADLEALYEETFDRETMEQAVAEDGTLATPDADQRVYIDLSEPDNAIVYDTGNTWAGVLFRSIGDFFSSLLEYFR